MWWKIVLLVGCVCGKMLSNEICNMPDRRERQRGRDSAEREFWGLQNISLFNWVRADLMCVHAAYA